MKIKYKIFLLIVGLLIPSLALLILIVPKGIESRIIMDAEGRLLSARNVAYAMIDRSLKDHTEEELKASSIDLARELKDMLDMRVSIYSTTGMLADSSYVVFKEIPPEVSTALDGETAYRKTPQDISFAFPIESIGAVRLIYPMDMVNEIILQTSGMIVVVVMSILIVAILAAGLLARRFSKPITELNMQAGRIKAGEYDLDISIKSNDEIGELGKSFLDMSREIKDRIKQLETMVEREKQLKDLQKNFLNSVTHEFKTPLTSIIGYADLLKQYSDDPVLREDAARVIKSEGERLYQMVEKVLYLSRAERLDFHLESKEFEIEALIDKAIEGVSIKASSASISIIKDVKYHGKIMGDFDMLYSMLINLLDNAVKYNRHGGTVAVSTLERKGYVEVNVKDTGLGIGREHLDKIFQPFYREDKNRSRKMGGDGLGLSIVKEIVTRHSGDVSIDSEKGKWTEVKVLLPL